jgi:iron complex outermembrane receptor protein
MPLPRFTPLALLTLVASAPTEAAAQSPSSLEDITVTISRTTMSLGLAGLSASLIPKDRLSLDGPFPRLQAALAYVPGVVVRDRVDAALGPRISIRGAGARANFGIRGVRILVDGVPATLADGQATLTTLDLELAERIEIGRGSMSMLHGNGSQGIVALSTPGRLDGSIAGSAATEFGSFGSRGIRAVAGGGNNRLGGLVALSHSSTDGAREHSAAEKLSLRGSLEWRLGARTTITTRGRLDDDPWLQAPGALTLSEFQLDSESASPSAVARGTGKMARQKQLSYTLETAGRLSEARVTGWVIGRDLFNPIGLRPADAATAADGTLIEIDRSVRGVRGEFTRRIGSSSRLTAGLDIQRQYDDRRNSIHRGGEPTRQTLFLHQFQTVNEIGPFAQLVHGLSGSVALRAGIRHDRVSFEIDDRLNEFSSGKRTMSAWTFSAALSAQRGPLDGWLGIGSSFDTPTTTELVGEPDGLTGINSLLDPARSTSLEMGVRTTGNRSRFELVGWLRSTTDAITPLEQIDGRSYYTNIGRVDLKGIEAAGFIQAGSWLDLRAAATVMEARFGTGAVGEEGDALTDNRVPGIPSYSAQLGATASFGRLLVHAGQSWSGDLTADDSNELLVGGWGAGITNLTLRLTVDQNLEITALGNNLFDRQYVASVIVNGFGGRVVEPGSRRSLRVGAEVRFGR